MKRVLMVAYHFPPLAGSSGIQRSLRFVQQLPRFGWQPLVLSANARAYERTSTDLDDEVPSGTVVRRAFALDASRHFALAGRHLGVMARPDRWSSWKFDGVRQGMRLIRKYQPHAIWSTFPIATAHVIAAELHRRSGLPWIADFRDPMAQDGYPSDPVTWRQFDAIEACTIRNARFSMFTTPSAARKYRARYTEQADRIVVLENGYDEESFAAIEEAGVVDAPLHPGATTLLHSGAVYAGERDPTQLFVALGRLWRSGAIAPDTLKLRFRASANDDLLRRLAAEHAVEPFIDLCPPIAYRAALKEMLLADALLVMQGASCNEQIPAKIYEYLRARRPILCLSDPAGDTATVLRAARGNAIVRLDDADEIVARLPDFIRALHANAVAMPDMATVLGASRHGRTEVLARHLDDAIRG
jgi:glycosyltransferase involved in cell wall biosynthesis